MKNIFIIVAKKELLYIQLILSIINILIFRLTKLYTLQIDKCYLMNAILLPIHNSNIVKILSHTSSSMIEIIYNINKNEYTKNEISKFRGKIFEISTKHNLLIAMGIY